MSSSSQRRATITDFLKGQQHITPFPPVDDVIDRCLRLLCDPNDIERAFVKFDTDDSVVLLVNNYGGLSNLELGALTNKALEQLGKLFQVFKHIIAEFS